MDIQKLVANFLDLQEKYSFEKRTLITADRYEQIALTGLVAKDDFNNEALREPLIEHVGHLPILAVYFHPFVEHRTEIDLGLALQMLAIHDIGETEVGDVFTYSKTATDENAEYEAARQLIHPTHHHIYEEFEDRKTMTSKFAKAMDALAPITHSMYRPMVKLIVLNLETLTCKQLLITKQSTLNGTKYYWRYSTFALNTIS